MSDTLKFRGLSTVEVDTDSVAQREIVLDTELNQVAFGSDNTIIRFYNTTQIDAMLDTGLGSIDGLSDVVINNPQTGDLLRYDGNFWFNVQLTSDQVIEGTTNLYSQWSDVAGVLNFDGDISAETLTLEATDPSITLQDTSGTDTFSTIRQTSNALFIDTRQDTNAGATIFRQWNGTEEQEVMRIDAGGKVGIGVTSPGVPLDVEGNVRAAGIMFESVSSSVNTLDDYEEGLWTPTYDGASANPTCTYDQRQGSYVKVGRLVTISGRLRTDSVSGGSGSLRVSGLPFTVSASSADRGYVGISASSSWTGETPVAGLFGNNSVNFQLYANGSSNTANRTSVNVTDMNTGTNDNNIYFSGQYYTDA